MKVPQGFARSKGSQGSVSKKVFLAKKKKKKENILGSHLRESKLIHIRIMCSPPICFCFYFFTFHAQLSIVATTRQLRLFLTTATNLKSVLILKKKMFCLSVSPIQRFSDILCREYLKKRFQSVVIFIPIFSITWSSLRILK